MCDQNKDVYYGTKYFLTETGSQRQSLKLDGFTAPELFWLFFPSRLLDELLIQAFIPLS